MADVSSQPILEPRFRARLAPIELDRLTPRQREVFWLLSYGESNKAIAVRLNVSEPTIKSYVSTIMRIAGCSNRTQAALIGMAMREGLPI